jgi:Holliday junction resolvase RusA-like endonuclease
MGRIYEIVIGGHISSKKNELRFNGHTGRPYYPPETRANMDEINEQVIRQWTDFRANGDFARQPLTHPALGFTFYVQTTRSDRDNKLSTLMDCLVAGGVLKDDSIEDSNELILIGKAYKQREPGVAGARIFIEPSGDFDRLYAYMRQQDLTDIAPIKAQQAKRRLERKRHFRGRS